MRLSVIVCTYNPTPDILKRCLDDIKKALLHVADAEVIVVDNNSTTPISSLPWLPEIFGEHWKLVVETTQGLTPARIRGIHESRGDLLVYVDDDNFVQADFFEKGIALAERNPHIGAYSGQVKLIFKETPEDWTKPYWGLLVYREFSQDVWSNLPHLTATMPCGAGLYIRREVADFYQRLHREGKRKIQLDRTGKSLFSGGDNDMAACSCDLGMGVGLFHELVLLHYIPENRTKKDYLLKLAQGIAASTVIFKAYRHEYPQSPSLKSRTANVLRGFLKSDTERAFFKAELRGEEEGIKMLAGFSGNK